MTKELASPPALLALVDVPEERRRRAVEHAGDRLPPGARNGELPERNVGHLVVGLLLDFGRDLLLLVGRGRARELVLPFFDLEVLRPAEPAAILAAAANREIDQRVYTVGGD